MSSPILSAESSILSAETIRRRLGARTPKALPRTDLTKLSAVAAVLRFDRHGPEVMLIRRADRPNDHWAGHMAFPGGRKDPTDATTLHTALRETREEVAVDLERGAKLLGQLDEVQAISKGVARDLLIVPYVFELTATGVEPVLDPDEVAELIWAPIGPMLSGEVACVRPYVHRGTPMELPGFQVGEHIVWGLTYRMLELLFEAVQPR